MICRCHRIGRSLLRAVALPPWLVVWVDAWPPLLGRRPLPLDIVASASRFSCRIVARGVGCALCLLCVALLSFVLSLCFLVCVCVFNISLFLVLCALVLVNLCLATSRLCL